MTASRSLVVICPPPPLNNANDFFYPDHHSLIDNTTLTPDVVARRVMEHFHLPHWLGVASVE